MSDAADRQVHPQPLTPADCYVGNFDYMPLDVDRLLGSRAWLICKRRPELAFYMVNIWAAAWMETPAASLENDDDWLADKARCAFEHWVNIREDVLRGFVLCSDGRLYHELIAVKALEAWLEKLGSRISSGAGNAAKYKTKFDDSHLREQVQLAVSLLFALDPNSRYFTKRSGVVARLGAKTPAKPRAPRQPKAAKPAPDNGNSSSPGGSESGLPGGDDQHPREIALNSTPLGSTPLGYVGGEPPTTPGDGAPDVGGDPAGEPADETPDAEHLVQPDLKLQTRGKPSGGKVIEMAVRELVLPDWLSPHEKAWNDFQELRWKKNGRAPYTKAAQDGILRELKKFHEQGMDLTAVLTTSLTNGWTGVFPQRGARRPALAGNFAAKDYRGGDLERDFSH